jgi:hypothetical protein
MRGASAPLFKDKREKDMGKTINVTELSKELQISVDLTLLYPTEKTFKIARITTATNMMYSKMRQAALEATQAMLKANQLINKATNETDPKKQEKIAKEAQELTDGLKNEDKDYYRITDRLVKLILETNGYEYDRKYWTEVTYQEKQMFIKSSIEKDIEDSKKKILGEKQEIKK